MPKSGTFGSVRGVFGNGHSYRDQFFSGMEYYSPKLPCDPAQISRFRKILGEAGVEQLLKTTIEAAVAMKAVKKTEFERVIVDTTVQDNAVAVKAHVGPADVKPRRGGRNQKAIAHPTDARLLDVARQLLVRHAKRAGLALKQDSPRLGLIREADGRIPWMAPAFAEESAFGSSRGCSSQTASAAAPCSWPSP
jgi:hypothetical protein